MKKMQSRSAEGRVMRSSAGRSGAYRSGALRSEQASFEAVSVDIVELIQRACAEPGRRAMQIASAQAKGRVFVEQGHVVHAEFGEDYGLRAVVELLRAGPLTLEPWGGSWPGQPSLHLGADLLLSMVGRDASGKVDTRVVRKVDQPEHGRAVVAEPPPLPDPDTFLEHEPAASGRPVSELPPRTSLIRSRRNAFESSSMVRVSTRGALFAAHGRNAARLVDSAAFIHDLANAIASDLGGQEPAAIHLRGRGRSLFVVRSEVGDVAAASGHTRRLEPLLRKVGL